MVKRRTSPLEFEFFLIFLVKFEFYFVVKNEPSIFRISRALLMRDVIASSFTFTFTFTVSLAFALAKELKNLNFVNNIWISFLKSNATQPNTACPAAHLYLVLGPSSILKTPKIQKIRKYENPKIQKFKNLKIWKFKNSVEGK